LLGFDHTNAAFSVVEWSSRIVVSAAPVTLSELASLPSSAAKMVNGLDCHPSQTLPSDWNWTGQLGDDEPEIRFM